LLGVAIVAAAVVPWVWAIASRFGWSEYASLVWNETMGRAGGSSEGHLGPPGMHAVLLIALLWPASLSTARAVRDAFSAGWPLRNAADLGKPWWKRMWIRRLGKPQDAFLLAWALPGWVFFELFGAKLAHYPMPLYPAVAILSARAAVAMTARGVHPGRLDKGIWLAIGMALAITAILAGATDLSPSSAHALRGSLAIACGAVAFGLLVLASLKPAWTPDRLLRLGRWSMLLTLIAAFTSGSNFIPGAESERIMDTVRSVPGWDVRPIASTHRQDSMVFHTRGRVARLDLQAVSAWRNANPDGIVVLRKDEAESLRPTDPHRMVAVPKAGSMMPGRDWVVLVPTPAPAEGGRMPGE
jgi:4-amino-4-deoxy-L-arabinose transferase-like glycosyltransferase